MIDVFFQTKTNYFFVKILNPASDIKIIFKISKFKSTLPYRKKKETHKTNIFFK